MATEHRFESLDEIRVHPFVRRFGRMTFILVVILIGMLFLPWEQTVQGSGKIVAFDPTERHYELKSPHAGFVSEYLVQENQHVMAGDPLCVITDQDPQYNVRLGEKERLLQQQLDEAEVRLNSLKAEFQQLLRQHEAGLDLYDKRIALTEKKLHNLTLKETALSEDLRTTAEHFRRVSALESAGVESRRSLEVIRNQNVQAQTAFDQNRVQMEIERNNLDILENEKSKFDAQQQALQQKNTQGIASAKGVIQSLQSQLLDAQTNTSRYANRVIRADKNGTVMRIYHSDRNRLVSQGEPLMHFVPDVSQRSILLGISDFHMPLIKKGLPARIKFHGWPALQISGWPKIAFGTFGGYVHAFEPITHEAGVYYVHVFEDPDEPWPDDEVLRNGTQATVWVRLESVPVWYQIWRTINAMPPNMPQER